VTKGAATLVREVMEDLGGRARVALAGYLRSDSQASPVWRLAADYPERGGRALRASICIAAARAHGASLDDAVDSAAALELMHNAFLVHDDIEDGSEDRRGRPTMHTLHGVPVAVNVGDALVVASLAPLVANRFTLGPHLALRVLEETALMARESVEGQALELEWRSRNVLDLEDRDYLNMILKKTCWYTTIYPCRVGALIGSRDRVDLQRYVRFGFFLGAAFQIQDDLLNLVGDPLTYGKELNGDILEGKRTLVLIALLRGASTAERKRLGDVLSRPRERRTAADVAWMRASMDGRGCIAHARRMAHAFVGAAKYEFENAFGDVPDSREKRFLSALPEWVIERN
jgi:geranylgeranyl diphosphate synthase type II